MNAITGLMAETAFVSPAHPDADLIRLCAEHVVNMNAYNRDGREAGPGQPDPLWDAYASSRDAITAAKPRTMAGLLAKARAAKAEAATRDDTDCPEGTPAATWAWALVNDLLGDVLSEYAQSVVVTPSPDADLIKACAAFDAIEAKRDALYARDNPAYIPDENAREEAESLLCEEQDSWVEKISDTRARTCAGVFAKLRSMTMWDKELLKPGGGDIGYVLLASACRDILAGPL